MTTFQDPPPQSRRAVRASERGETASAPAPVAPTEGTPYNFEAAAPAEPAAQASAPPLHPQSGRRAQTRVAPNSDSDSLLAHLPAPGHSAGAPVGETPEQAAYRMRDFSPEGRRSAGSHQAGPESPAASFAPPARPVELDYQTHAALPGASRQAAQQPPLDDTLNHTLSRRELREMRAAAEAAAPPLQAPAPAAGLPEAIDTLLNSGPIEIPTLAPPPGQSQALAEAMAEFDMLTRARRESEARARDAQVASLATPIVHPTPAVSEPVPADAVPSAPVAPAPVASAPVAPEAFVSQPAIVAPVASAPQAPVQQLPFDELLAPSAPEAPSGQHSSEEPTAESGFFPPAAALFAVVEPVASEPTEAEPETTEAEPDKAEEPVVATIEEAPMLLAPTFSDLPSQPAAVHSVPISVVPVTSVPLNSVPLNSAPIDSAPATSAPADEQDTHGGRSPRASGHWRVQAAIEDEDLPFENTLSRTVGSNTSAITTSALVLPSVPSPDGLLNNLTATGEILVTGTIDLPSSLGSTGAHPSRIDNSDFEDDPLDSQVAAPDSAPIRAIRAISTHTSTRGVIETKRPSGTRALTAVIAVASVLCVGLVGLLVFAFATGKL